MTADRAAELRRIQHPRGQHLPHNVTANVTIYNASPGDVKLSRTDHGGMHLTLTAYGNGAVWYTLGDERFTTDLAEEAQAMRKLAGLAAEAAAELELRAVAAQQPETPS